MAAIVAGLSRSPPDQREEWSAAVPNMTTLEPGIASAEASLLSADAPLPAKPLGLGPRSPAISVRLRVSTNRSLRKASRRATNPRRLSRYVLVRHRLKGLSGLKTDWGELVLVTAWGHEAPRATDGPPRLLTSVNPERGDRPNFVYVRVNDDKANWRRERSDGPPHGYL